MADACDVVRPAWRPAQGAAGHLVHALAAQLARVQGATQLAVAAALVAAGSATLGFLAGIWAAGRGGASRNATPRWDRPGIRSRDDLCECGKILFRNSTQEEIDRHKSGKWHRKNLLLLGNASEVVVCEEVSEYRDAAKGLVGPDDLVLEVGCHVGGTSKVLASVARRLVGLDQRSSLVDQARVNLPGVQFEVGDAFDVQRVLALAHSVKPDRFTKIFVDISGSRDLPTVMRLMDIYENTLRPELLVVKSQLLKRLLLRSRLWINHPAFIGEPPAKSLASGRTANGRTANGRNPNGKTSDGQASNGVCFDRGLAGHEAASF